MQKTPVFYKPTGSAVNAYTPNRCFYVSISSQVVMIYFVIELTSTAVSGECIIKSSDINNFKAYSNTQFGIAYANGGAVIRCVWNYSAEQFQVETLVNSFPKGNTIYGQFMLIHT